MSSSGKVWDIREAYKQQRNNAWSRGDIGLGSSGDSTNGTINKVQISTTGNAVGFGDVLTASTANGGAMSGGQYRALFAGGDQPSVSNVICYKQYSSDGNFADFGDLSAGRQLLTGTGNATRGIFAGGRTGIGPTVPSNVIDAVSYASLGNATDFGDLTVARIGLSSMQSPTRGVFAGGGSPANVIDFITFSSAGNATDFGDLTGVSSKNYFGGSSTEIKGVFAGGGAPGDPSTINILTIASAGNSEDFGDLTQSRILMASASNGTRSVFFGGQQNAPGGPASNVIDYVTIATTGNATDFGDVSGASTFASGGTSNGHGGIVLGELQRPYVYYSPTGKIVPRGGGVGDICIVGGGESPSPSNVIDVVQISTLGNAQDFGDLYDPQHDLMSSMASANRILFPGGTGPSNIIQYVEFDSKGNAADFGDLTVATRSSCGHGNDTRGVNGGGYTPSASNVIDYVTFATIGNAADFGDLTVGVGGLMASGSNTRSLFGGGYDLSVNRNEISYITTASTGNATDFGDLTVARNSGSSFSSSTRSLFAGGSGPSPYLDVIDYVTIASTGNATDFGDLTVARIALGPRGSNQTRGLTLGGYQSPGTDSDVIDYVTIASTGNAADFGNLTVARRTSGGYSNGHGGLS